MFKKEVIFTLLVLSSSYAHLSILGGFLGGVHEHMHDGINKVASTLTNVLLPKGHLQVQVSPVHPHHGPVVNKNSGEETILVVVEEPNKNSEHFAHHEYHGQHNHNGYQGQQNHNGYQGQQNHNGYQGQQNHNGYQGQHNHNGYEGQQNYNGYQGQQNHHHTNQGQQNHNLNHGHHNHHSNQGFQNNHGSQAHEFNLGNQANNGQHERPGYVHHQKPTETYNYNWKHEYNHQYQYNHQYKYQTGYNTQNGGQQPTGQGKPTIPGHINNQHYKPTPYQPTDLPITHITGGQQVNQQQTNNCNCIGQDQPKYGYGSSYAPTNNPGGCKCPATLVGNQENAAGWNNNDQISGNFNSNGFLGQTTQLNSGASSHTPLQIPTSIPIITPQVSTELITSPKPPADKLSFIALNNEPKRETQNDGKLEEMPEELFPIDIRIDE